MSTLNEKAMGCMLGGAFGDSVGAPLEFMRRRQIGKEFADKDLADPPLGFPGRGNGSITDDTQQALCVARGLTHGMRRGGQDKVLTSDIWFQLRQWHALQLEDKTERRSPGSTSMATLGLGRPGTIDDPVNSSPSCGAVMRAHPIGILCAGDPERAFKLGCKVGALTHGHPDAYAPSGALAAMVAILLANDKATVTEAAQVTLEMIQSMTPDAVRTIKLLRMAIKAGLVTTEVELGCGATGWTGDEALAMGVFAARKHEDDLKAAVVFASVHDGDSDSTASIAGALVGAKLGASAIPLPWRDTLEHADELKQRARELADLSQR